MIAMMATRRMFFSRPLKSSRSPRRRLLAPISSGISTSLLSIVDSAIVAMITMLVAAEKPPI